MYVLYNHQNGDVKSIIWHVSLKPKQALYGCSIDFIITFSGGRWWSWYLE